MAVSLSSSNDWPENLTELKSLDFLLRCGICHDFFKNCMMTKCSHNFCSYCIRKYMSTKSVCPSCFQVATEPELLSNRALDDIVKVFVLFRNKRIDEKNDLDVCMDFTTSISHESQSVSDTSKNFSTTHDCIGVRSSKSVGCPICAKIVPFTQINEHMDICLTLNEDQPKVKMEQIKRTYLPKKVYKIMKEKDLRDDLKKYGINSKGNKEALINRHKKFVILYNADCDSENPMTVPELVQQLEREEAAIQENIKSNNKVFKVNCSSHPDEIDRERKAYLKQNKGHYSLLVKQAHINSEKNESKSSSSDDAKPSTSGIGNRPNDASNPSVVRLGRRSSGSFSSEDSYKCVNLQKSSGLPLASANEILNSHSGMSVNNSSDSDDKRCDLQTKQSKYPASSSGSSTEILDENSDDLEEDQDYLKTSAAVKLVNQTETFTISSDSDCAGVHSNLIKKRKLTELRAKSTGRSLHRRKSKK